MAEKFIADSSGVVINNVLVQKNEGVKTVDNSNREVKVGEVFVFPGEAGGGWQKLVKPRKYGDYSLDIAGLDDGNNVKVLKVVSPERIICEYCSHDTSQDGGSRMMDGEKFYVSKEILLEWERIMNDPMRESKLKQKKYKEMINKSERYFENNYKMTSISRMSEDSELEKKRTEGLAAYVFQWQSESHEYEEQIKIGDIISVVKPIWLTKANMASEYYYLSLLEKDATLKVVGFSKKYGILCRYNSDNKIDRGTPAVDGDFYFLDGQALLKLKNNK